MLAADTVEPITSAGHAQLGIAVLAGIAVIVLLITKFKLHAFLSLTIGSLALGAFAGAPLDKVITSFTSGLGSTVAGVGVLIALGAILGKLLADSGGADQVVDTILAKASGRAMPWAMVLIASVIGLPLFFEVGIVLLIPVVLMVARRGNFKLMRIGIPALAGLSVMHGLVPPHPGPLVAIDAVKANLGVTLALGVLVAIPTVIIAGPVFSKFAARWADVPVPERMLPPRASEELEKRPGFGATMFTVLLPVVLMLAKALVDIVIDDADNTVQRVFDVIGSPLIALLAAVIVGIFTLGRLGRVHAVPDIRDRREGAHAHRGHPADRRCGRWLQADADRLRCRADDPGDLQGLVDSGAVAGVADRGGDPVGDGVGDGGDGFGGGAGGAAGGGHVDDACGVAGAGDRGRVVVLQPCQ